MPHTVYNLILRHQYGAYQKGLGAREHVNRFSEIDALNGLAILIRLTKGLGGPDINFVHPNCDTLYTSGWMWLPRAGGAA